MKEKFNGQKNPTNLRIVETKKNKKEFEKKLKEMTDYFEEKKEELSNMKFAVDATDDVIDKLNYFLQKDIEWAYNESIGVVQCADSFTKAYNDFKSGKEDKVLLRNIELEALNFFFSKIKGVGYKKAKDNRDMIVAVIGAVGKANDIKEELGKIERNIASFEQGLPHDEIHAGTSKKE